LITLLLIDNTSSPTNDANFSCFIFFHSLRIFPSFRVNDPFFSLFTMEKEQWYAMVFEAVQEV
jgi:hypothetical protein